MIKKYGIQCAVRGCTAKRDRKESVPIHRFAKRGDTGQRWIEACANSYLSRLEYRQVVERKLFACHRNFHMLLRFEVRCIRKFSVYLLEIKIQFTDIFDFYLLRLNQDLMLNCENLIQE